jgi:hypothetical protein
MEFLTFFYGVIFALLDPDRKSVSGSIANPDTDPGTPLNPDPIRIHNTAFGTVSRQLV